MEDKLFLAGTVFTPSSPVRSRDLFSGRFDKITAVINGINQIGQHVIIYGERGVGKTSLSNVLHDFLPNDHGIISVRVNCDGRTTFENLFKAILSEIKLQIVKPGFGFNAQDTTELKGLDEFLNKDKDLNPNELRFVFRSLNNKIIVIIDEFDRVENPDVKKLLADTIKNFSDYGVDTTFILVGVADSVEGLIAEHQSTERALVQIQMPRMSRSELNMIIENGLKKLQMSIEQSAKDYIINLSQGLPHYTHLLSLHATQSAIEKDRQTIKTEDVNEAIKRAVEQTQQTVLDAYYKAIYSPKGNLYPQVLLACAMAKKDEMGYFIATSIKTPLSTILERDTSAFAKHLVEFCSNDRGPALNKSGYARRYRYRFSNPLLEPFIIMKGLAEHKINDSNIAHILAAAS